MAVGSAGVDWGLDNVSGAGEERLASLLLIYCGIKVKS